MVVLLTGATGFVGSALLRRLQNSGFNRENDVFCLSSSVIPGWKCINHRDWNFRASDIADAIGKKIDVVVHCGAATPHAPEDFAPARAARFAANVRNTCWLCENLPSPPGKFVFISTTDVYGKSVKAADEQTLIAPASMYGASKFMCERYLDERAKKDGFKLDVLRLGPIYGEGEEAYSKIVSSFVAKIDAGEEILLHGTGEELRSLLHVDDCCACIAHAMAAEKSLPVVNVVSGKAVSISQIIGIIANAAGKTPCISKSGGAAGRSDSFDNGLAKKLFGDYERPLEEGILSYVRYFRQGRAHAHM